MSPRGLPVSPHGYVLAVGLVPAALGAVTLARRAELSWGWAYLAAVNVAALVLYAWDKAAATRRGFRVPEAMLHLVALIGGTPAALVARVVLRHKTRKRDFRIMFWCIAVLQLAAVAVWGWSRL